MHIAGDMAASIFSIASTLVSKRKNTATNPEIAERIASLAVNILTGERNDLPHTLVATALLLALYQSRVGPDWLLVIPDTATQEAPDRDVFDLRCTAAIAILKVTRCMTGHDRHNRALFSSAVSYLVMLAASIGISLPDEIKRALEESSQQTRVSKGPRT